MLWSLRVTSIVVGLVKVGGAQASGPGGVPSEAGAAAGCGAGAAGCAGGVAGACDWLRVSFGGRLQGGGGLRAARAGAGGRPSTTAASSTKRELPVGTPLKTAPRGPALVAFRPEQRH